MANSFLAIDGLETLKDRYVPRYEVFFAKPQAAAPGPAPDTAVLEPNDAIAEEKARLDASIYLASDAPGAPPPKLNQLLPLAGPYGEKANQRTDDILSITFNESVEKNQPLAQVTIEVLNVYDTVRKFYRYTDIPPTTDARKAGVYPLLDYGDTIALRFGYGANLDWVFDGIVTKISVSFPADGESRVSITAVDKRDRLRSKKDIGKKPVGGSTEAEIAQQISRTVGLRVAAPPTLKPATSKGKKQGRPTDQDALQYITDRANKANLELLCFGNTLFVQEPGDKSPATLHYGYRQGLISFEPTFNGTGKPTKVTVKGRNSNTKDPVEATVTSEDLAAAGLIPPIEEEGTALDKVEDSGQAGERIEIVTNYPVDNAEQAKRIAIGILKRNLDETLTVTGNLVGDPRVRARTVLAVTGVGRFNGEYYITSATHKLGGNGYQTEFSARRNKALSQSGPAANGNGASNGTNGAAP
jgi:phage protein D